jgi:2-keto-3-deoxy-6-phosphogluconate aldolase
MTSRQHLAFLILIPGGGNTSLTSQSSGPYAISVAVIGDLASAKRLTRELINQGITTIELSASFNDDYVAAIRAIAGPSIRLGRVNYLP